MSKPNIPDMLDRDVPLEWEAASEKRDEDVNVPLLLPSLNAPFESIHEFIDAADRLSKYTAYLESTLAAALAREKLLLECVIDISIYIGETSSAPRHRAYICLAAVDALKSEQAGDWVADGE